MTQTKIYIWLTELWMNKWIKYKLIEVCILKHLNKEETRSGICSKVYAKNTDQQRHVTNFRRKCKTRRRSEKRDVTVLRMKTHQNLTERKIPIFYVSRHASLYLRSVEFRYNFNYRICTSSVSLCLCVLYSSLEVRRMLLLIYTFHESCFMDGVKAEC